MESILTVLATYVRRALEDYCRGSAEPLWDTFPAGSCGPASELLGRYLEMHGWTPVRYVWGNRGGRSHGWVEAGGFIVDITADQFGLPSVIVANRSEWHEGWQREDIS